MAAASGGTFPLLELVPPSSPGGDMFPALLHHLALADFKVRAGQQPDRTLRPEHQDLVRLSGVLVGSCAAGSAQPS